MLLRGAASCSDVDLFSSTRDRDGTTSRGESQETCQAPPEHHGPLPSIPPCAISRGRWTTAMATAQHGAGALYIHPHRLCDLSWRTRFEMGPPDSCSLHESSSCFAVMRAIVKLLVKKTKGPQQVGWCKSPVTPGTCAVPGLCAEHTWCAEHFAPRSWGRQGKEIFPQGFSA